MARRHDKRHVPFVGHLNLIDRKGIQVDGSLRPLVGAAFPFRIPHQEFSGWNRRHRDRIPFF
mgnify:CR=1 FL=1